ncbi:hypothetical protein [Enterovirga sp.]|uniref:hypothetical protein n=1 Tax=Enterovirga sp. TaxID=2026350 RepID=UPI0026169B60|nr:hypothetical protein [Enterovirga sp.]
MAGERQQLGHPTLQLLHLRAEAAAIVDGGQIGQEQDLGGLQILRADVDEPPSTVAPDDMMLGFEVEAGQAPDPPAMDSPPSRSIVRAT